MLSKENQSNTINLYKKGLNPKIISKKLGFSIYSIYQVLRKNNIKIPRLKYLYKIEEIVDLYKKGKHPKEISEIMGIASRSTIRRYLRKNGIKLRNKSESRLGEKNYFYRKKHTKETISKISKAKKGKENKKHSKFMKEHNPMKREELRELASKRMLKKFEDIREGEYINFGNFFKNKIRRRDNQICMLCGIHREKLKKALNVHHVNYDKGLAIPENCISLCKSCHGKTNWNRKVWIKIFQDILSDNYGYKYEHNLPIIEVIKVK